jgi:Mce-associated membrane protein
MSQPSRATIALLAVTVLITGLALAAWLSSHQADQRERAAQQALDAATAATRALFSYDYRHFDASIANAGAFVTGSFAKEYNDTANSLKAAAVREEAVVRADVSSAAVMQATNDQVEILLYVNQYRRNINISGEKVDQDRVVLTLVPADGTWKVVAASAI